MKTNYDNVSKTSAAYLKKFTPKLFLLLVIATYSHSLHGQNIQDTEITWQISQYIDSNRVIVESDTERFVSHGNTRIDWYDAHGNTKYSFSVAEVNGQWSDVKKNGEIIYEVVSQARQGTIQFSRKEGIVSIKIVLLDSGNSPDIFRLSISSFSTH